MFSYLKRILISAISLKLVGAALRPIYGGIGVIFTLHRVVENQKMTVVPGVTVTVDFLDQLLSFVKNAGFDVITLSEVAQRLVTKDTKRRFVCFTFDDGYMDTYTLALPVFNRYGFRFNAFLVSSFVEQKIISTHVALEEFILYNDRVRLPHSVFSNEISTLTYTEKNLAFFKIYGQCWKDPIFAANLVNMIIGQGFDAHSAVNARLLGVSEAKALALNSLCEIGSHSVSHAALNKLSDSELMRELSESRDILSSITGYEVDLLAYPFGSAETREFIAARKAGYSAAVTVCPGNIFPEHHKHLLALPRVGLSLWPHAHNLNYIRASVSGVRNAVMNKGRRLS